MKRILSFILSLIVIVSLAAPVDAAQKPKLSKTKVTLTVSESVKHPTFTLKVKGTKKKAKWSTSNKKVATVKKGKITAKGKGKATITCKVSGKKLTCKVTVSECKHNWNKHWAVYEREQVIPYGDLMGSSICSCGLITIEMQKSGYVHRPSYEPHDIQNSIGLHGSSTTFTFTDESFLGEDERGVPCMYNRHITRTQYVDYMDCTKCGEYVDALDLPKN